MDHHHPELARTDTDSIPLVFWYPVTPTWIPQLGRAGCPIPSSFKGPSSSSAPLYLLFFQFLYSSLLPPWP